MHSVHVWFGQAYEILRSLDESEVVAWLYFALLVMKLNGGVFRSCAGTLR